MSDPIVAALVEAGATLEYIKVMIEDYERNYHPNTVAKQTPFTGMAMIYAAVCEALGKPVMRDLLATREVGKE